MTTMTNPSDKRSAEEASSMTPEERAEAIMTRLYGIDEGSWPYGVCGSFTQAIREAQQEATEHAAKVAEIYLVPSDPVGAVNLVSASIAAAIRARGGCDGEWRPIETVPLDRKVQLGRPGKIELGYVTKTGRKHIRRHYWSSEGPTPYEGPFPLSFEPTHWMPRPPPPEQD